MFKFDFEFDQDSLEQESGGILDVPPKIDETEKPHEDAAPSCEAQLEDLVRRVLDSRRLSV